MGRRSVPGVGHDHIDVVVELPGKLVVEGGKRYEIHVAG